MKKVVKRTVPGMSILTVLVTMSAWLAISNHCALGAAAAPEIKSTPNECPFHSKRSTPARPKQSSDSPCCKILRAIVASSAKDFARPMVDLAGVDFSFAKLLIFAPPKISFDSFALDTGPPGTTSFPELIGSMLAHAPPIVV